MKRLYKSDRDRKICGVCAGIADYFGVDPTLIRVLFVIGMVCCGLGVLPYFILAAVMPHESEVTGYYQSSPYETTDYDYHGQ